MLRQPRLRPLGVPGLSVALQLSFDDGRSANRLYQSVCSMKAEDVRLRVEREYASYTSDAAQPEVAAEAQVVYTNSIEDIEAEARLLQHRYLDDVESALWLFCHIVSGLSGKGRFLATCCPLMRSHFTRQLSVSYPSTDAPPLNLDDVAAKQILWRGFLFPVSTHDRSKESILSLLLKPLLPAKSVRQGRPSRSFPTNDSGTHPNDQHSQSVACWTDAPP